MAAATRRKHWAPPARAASMSGSARRLAIPASITTFTPILGSTTDGGANGAALATLAVSAGDTSSIASYGYGFAVAGAAAVGISIANAEKSSVVTAEIASSTSVTHFANVAVMSAASGSVGPRQSPAQAGISRRGRRFVHVQGYRNGYGANRQSIHRCRPPAPACWSMQPATPESVRNLGRRRCRRHRHRRIALRRRARNDHHRRCWGQHDFHRQRLDGQRRQPRAGRQPFGLCLMRSPAAAERCYGLQGSYAQAANNSTAVGLRRHGRYIAVGQCHDRGGKRHRSICQGDRHRGRLCRRRRDDFGSIHHRTYLGLSRRGRRHVGGQSRLAVDHGHRHRHQHCGCAGRLGRRLSPALPPSRTSPATVP